MKNIKIPTASKFTVLRQFCNYIPNHLVPKLKALWVGDVSCCE